MGEWIAAALSAHPRNYTINFYMKLFLMFYFLFKIPVLKKWMVKILLVFSFFFVVLDLPWIFKIGRSMTVFWKDDDEQQY